MIATMLPAWDVKVMVQSIIKIARLCICMRDFVHYVMNRYKPIEETIKHMLKEHILDAMEIGLNSLEDIIGIFESKALELNAKADNPERHEDKNHSAHHKACGKPGRIAGYRSQIEEHP